MADEEEKRPLRHLKFKEFTVLDSDLSADEIRRLYAEKMTELRNNAGSNSQKLEDLKKDRAEEKKDLSEQKADLGKDPQTFYTKMQQRYERAVAELDAEYPDKNDAEYSRRLTQVKERFAAVLDKKLLDTNQGAYVNKVMDTIERSEEKIDKELKTAETKTNAENNKLAASAKMLKDQQKLLEANPDLYAKLYNVKQRSGTRDEAKNDPQTMIMPNQKGQPCLAVVLQDARFPAGFIISDGKINFTQDHIDQMTVDKMREIVDYLERRGIKDIELPGGIDEKLAAMYNEAEQANKAAEEAARANEQEDPAAENAPIRPLPENNHEEIPSAGAANHDLSNENTNLGNETVVAAQTVDYGKAVKSIDDWVFGAGGLDKQRGWTGFKSYKGSSLGDFGRALFGGNMKGWDCWAIYDQGNFNNPELDGKIDKEGYMKVKYALKIYSRVTKDKNGNERLDIRYAMPNNKKITDDYADGLVGILKKAGNTHINFPNGLPESDLGTFRLSCAKQGIVPMMKNLDANKVKKMLEAAESKLKPKELIEYKLKLAEWMEKCALEDCAKNGQDMEEHHNNAIISSLRAEYEYAPFHDMYEKRGGMRGILENVVRENGENHKDGIVKIYAASSAVKDIFDVYKDNPNAPLGAVMTALAQKTGVRDMEQFKNDFMRHMAADEKLRGKALNLDKPLRDMSPREVGALMKAMLPHEEKIAQSKLEAKFKKSIDDYNSDVIGDKESTIISDFKRKSRENISNIDKELKDDLGVKGIFTPSQGDPDYDFTELRQKYPKKEKKGRQQDPRLYDDDYERNER